MISSDDLENGYRAIADRLYDLAYEKLRDPSGDREFYRDLALESGGPVLELGCGSGRVLLPIAREGLACTGLDASESMLATFRGKDPPPNLRLVHGRMEHFDLLPDRFALIFSAFRAFQHLMTVEEQLGCLETVQQHLAPGGLFAFDVFAPKLERLALAEEPESEDLRLESDGEEIRRFVSVRREQATQRMLATFRYERRRDGRVLDSHLARTSMRYFFRYELEHLLARGGLRCVALFGNFDRSPFEAGSPELILLARAKG